jgi:dolichol-phosphate mannosyltransferase
MVRDRFHGRNPLGVSPDMARVSLIVLKSPGIQWPSERVASYRAGLEDSGFSVEVLAVSDPICRTHPVADEPWCRSLVANAPGLAESAVAGIRAARGHLLVVVDLAMTYRFEDIFALVQTLEAGKADLAIANRPVGLVGWLAQRFLGTTDPTSGLVGLTRTSALEADDSLAPVGSRFTLELLARVAGRRVDVPVEPIEPISRRSTPLGDLRQLKRLADDRFGNASRLIQFCFVGASGMVVDLTFYVIFQAVCGQTALVSMSAPLVGGSMALAVSRVLAIAIALTWNFSINRRLTFNDSRQGSIPRQFLRYVLSNMLGIGVSLSLSLILPTRIGFFRAHRLAAAVVGIVAATGISFSMARWFVFGQKPSPVVDRPTRMTTRRCDGFRSKLQNRDRDDLEVAQSSAKDQIAG